MALQLVTIGLALVGAYSLLMIFITQPMHENSQDTWSAMEAQPLSCPDGTEVSRDGWSKSGYLRYCEPLREGVWEAWDSGYRNILGAYRNGKEHGVWIFYNEDGSVRQTIEYNDGDEVTGEEDTDVVAR